MDGIGLSLAADDGAICLRHRYFKIIALRVIQMNNVTVANQLVSFLNHIKRGVQTEAGKTIRAYTY